MKDRDTKGARFRDVMINRRKVEEQTQVEGGGEGGGEEGGLKQMRQGYLFPILKFTSQRIFQGNAQGVGGIAGKSLSVHWFALHLILFSLFS